MDGAGGVRCVVADRRARPWQMERIDERIGVLSTVRVNMWKEIRSTGILGELIGGWVR